MALGRSGLAGYPEISGDIANGVTDTSTANPVKVGGMVVPYRTTSADVLTVGSRANLIFTEEQRAYVNTAHFNFFHTTVAYASATTNSAVVAAPATSTAAIHITDIIVSSNTIGAVRFVEATAAPVAIIESLYLEANRPSVLQFKQPLTLTDNVNFGVTTNATVTSVYVAGFYA